MDIIELATSISKIVVDQENIITIMFIIVFTAFIFKGLPYIMAKMEQMLSWFQDALEKQQACFDRAIDKMKNLIQEINNEKNELLLNTVSAYTEFIKNEIAEMKKIAKKIEQDLNDKIKK